MDRRWLAVAATTRYDARSEERMPRLTGIELSATRCAVIGLEVSRRGAARVRAFRTLGWSPENPAALSVMLRSVRESDHLPARALVTVWGVGRSYRHVSLPSADDARLRTLALVQASTGPSSDGSAATSTVCTDRVADWRGRRVREATIVTAAAEALRSRLAPLTDAGFSIEAAITPPVALASLAWLTGGVEGDGLDAYVAVNADASAVAIVRHGALLFGREIPLPFGTARPDPAGDRRPFAGEAIEYVRRLAPELKRSFVAVRQQSRDEVRRVFLCGEFPDLRALTAPLMQALNVEVATLDVPQGLADADADIRERAGELRLAWATAADRARCADLQPRELAPPQRAGWRGKAGTIAAGLVLVVAAVLASRALTSRDEAPDVRVLRGEVARLESRLTAAERVHAAPPRPVAAEQPSTPGTSETPARPRRETPAATRVAPPPPPDVECILYGTDRRLALVDRRIVRVGDRVTGGVIADIEPRAVIVRRPSGDLWRVEVRQPGGAVPSSPRSDTR